jgi:hypothetical protein
MFSNSQHKIAPPGHVLKDPKNEIVVSGRNEVRFGGGMQRVPSHKTVAGWSRPFDDPIPLPRGR